MPATDMNRKDFLQLFGLGATALLTSACLGGCSSKSDPFPIIPPAGVDFTVDLAAPGSAALNDPAKGYIYGANRQVIVAKTTAGTYLALQAPCTHEGTTVFFEQGAGRFVCPNHGAMFTPAGAVITGPASTALKQFVVTQTGTTLRITG